MNRNVATILKLTIAVTALVGFGSKELTNGEGVPVPQGLNRRFEYQLSFKGPHLVQLDGSIPFWDHYGDAIASDESVRITPSMKSKKGAVWSKMANPHENWEVEVVFRVNGRGRIGADGLALWYTLDRGLDGPVFGSADQWRGLGVFFDSYDNDVMSNNPYIMIILNDGTKIYNHDKDGTDQISGGCMRDFRNKPYPTRAKLEYHDKTLTIHYHNGVTSNKDDYEICARVNDVELPKNGYFGVSAATGGLADDHDVLAFLTHSLTPTTEGTEDQSRDVTDEERKRYDQEFNDYRDKLDKAKEEYKKEHPSKPGEYVGDEEKMFEAPEMREMKMILDGQNEIYLLVKTIGAKLDEVVGRQEKELTLLTIINQRPGHDQKGSPSQQNPTEQQDVAGLLSSQQEVVSHMRDVRSVLSDVQQRVSSLGQGGVGSEKGGSEVLRHLGELKSHMSAMHGEVKSLISSKETGEGGPCPATNCITPVLLFLFLLGQLACLIGFLICRSRREAAAKKFY